MHLFNDDTHPSGHISRPTQVHVSQSHFHSLNRLIKPDYIVQFWGIVKLKQIASVRGWFKLGIVFHIWSFKSDWGNSLLARSPICRSRELSQREYPMSQLCSSRHDFPVKLLTPGAYGQWSVFNHNGDSRCSSGQDMGLGMTNSKSGDYLFSSG